MNTLFNRNPLPWVALISFLMSLCLGYNDIVNLDGILYLQVAKAFGQHEYLRGFDLYAWPFYSLMIAGLKAVTPFSLEHCAVLLNAGLMALMGSGFVALVRELGGNRQIQWVAVLVFLAHPALNGYREYIIRDFGAWGFLFWSLVYLCQYSKEPSWKAVFGWTLTAGAAVLFRPENIAWLALGPLILFAMKQRFVSILKLNTLFAGLLILFCASIFISDINLPTTKINELFNATNHLALTGWNEFSQRAQALQTILSPELKTHYAKIILGFALVSFLIFALAKTLSPFYLLLIGYAVVKRPLITLPQKRIVFWFLFLYAGMYLGFISKNYFISSRYLIPFVTVLMVWVPFALAHGWERSPKALKYLIGLILASMFISGVVHTGYSKEYLREAGHWIKENTPEDAKLYTENKQVAYYADRKVVANPGRADVIAIYYTRKNIQAHVLIESLSHFEQKDFHNKREDGVRIILNPSSRDTRGSYPKTDSAK